jgi:hypothetical protein
MSSTYSSLKIELMGTGDQSGTWGVTTNTNLGTAIEEAITGSADVSFSSADVTLTLTNTNTTQTARNLRLNLIGTVGATQNLIVPAIEKQYIINNTLGFAITVKNSTGTGVSVPAGKSMIVFNTGSNVVETVTALATGTVIPVANGGTGVTTSTGTGSVVLSASPTFTGAPLAPTAAPGTNTTQIATTAFVTAATGTLGTMSTQNANAVAITGGAINGTTIGASSASTGAFTTLSANSTTALSGTTSITGPLTINNLITAGETTTVSAIAATGTIAYDVLTQGVLYYTSNASANWTVNIRGNNTTTLNTTRAVGETRTITFFVTQGATAFFNSAVQVDGTTSGVTTRWQGGVTPSSGTVNAVDIYTYAIVKTASATFSVFASKTDFK